MKPHIGGKIFLKALILMIGLLLMGDAVWAATRDRNLYVAAKNEYDSLEKVTSKNRPRWESLAWRFQKIFWSVPESPYADDALFYAGRIHYELYSFEKKESSLDLAIKNWQTLLLKYPQSPLAEEGRYWLGLSYEEGKRDFAEAKKQYEAFIERSPKAELAAKARKRLEGLKKAEEAKKEQARVAEIPPVKALLTAIRNTSSRSYTRVTLELSSETRYETRRLKEDLAKGLPPRIYVDLLGTRLMMDSTQPIVVQDGLLRQVRVSQFSPDVVRVVLDMSSLTGYNAFLLPDPYRLVIDIQGEALASLERKRERPLPRESKKPQNGALRKIVLDPGHGGKDSGAIGVGGVAEKDIVLSVAKRLAKKLKNEMGVDVVLTRRDDTFIPLEDRTAIANAEEADLFISLHTNASPNAGARGIETYYLDNTTDEAALRLAARENATSRKGVTDLQFILSDLTQNSKLEDSISLAHRLQSALVSVVGQKHGEVRDLGVKKAQFFVLVGAKMPSVLVELFFVTNKDDARALQRSSYQEAIIEALYQGIKRYNEGTLVVKNL
ncbi:MAG TPA: N-acetylmuramoyl-L-alanine amidase [Candidatus Binatia bacterium]|jgi:N-acetylmuramoyl-L-alanine amidase|nr:N-acetylmuramoyl-L-alanine amidase [Candidatus Binatia bacterium]